MEAILEDTNLKGANFYDAYLCGAYFTNAIIEGVNFKYAKLKGTLLEGKGLENIDLNNKEISLSNAQVNLFNSILSDLRKLLVSQSISYALICERNDEVMLKIRRGNITKTFTMYHIVNKSLESCLERTVGLLIEKVPFNIKKISFSINNGCLQSGVYLDSKEEEGSVEIVLK